jgi:hypothetical protein
VLGELFPDLDQEQAVAEEDAARDVVNKTVRMEDDPLTREKYSTRRYPETPTVSPQPQFSYFKSKQDMICYNCGNRGHACRTCPSKSHLCAELNLSPSRLYHLGQDDVVGDDIQEKETTEEKDATTRLEQLTQSFRDLRPHRCSGLKTKAALKAFPTTTLSFPCRIQLNPGHRTEPPGEKSAENKTDSTKSADAEPHQTTQCGSDPRGEYLCLICKEKFCDGASLANHKNV